MSFHAKGIAFFKEKRYKKMRTKEGDNIMKKKTVLTLMLAGTLALCACSGNAIQNSQSTEQKSEVVDTSKDSETEISTTENSETDYGNAVKIDVSKLSEEYGNLYKNIYEGRVSKETYVPNGITPQEIKDVITGEGRFVNTDDNNKEIYLSELRREDRDMDFKPRDYMLVDLDLDGYNELMVSGLPESTEIFHYEDGVVYGYEFNYRATALPTTNGVLTNGSGTIWEYYRLNFDKDTYTEVVLYEVNEDAYSYTYEIDKEEAKMLGIEISESAFHPYFYELGYMWSFDKDEIIDVIDREKSYSSEAAEYIRSKDVPQEIIDVLLNDVAFTDTTSNTTVKSSEFSKLGQEFKVDKYTVVDLNGDGVNEVVTYFGDYIPLATIFTVSGAQVSAYTMLESEIWFINPNGVCYKLGAEDNEKISYRLECAEGKIKTTELCRMFSMVENSTGYALCEIVGEKASVTEFFEYFKELWNEQVPFCKDLSLIGE